MKEILIGIYGEINVKTPFPHGVQVIGESTFDYSKDLILVIFPKSQKKDL